MADPSYKDPKINRVLSSLLGKNREETITHNKCMGCPGEVTSFRDELSEKEYTISGLCQECQDRVFGS